MLIGQTLITVKVEENDMAKKVFISYDYDQDKTYKNLLKAWANNSADHFKGIDFEDASTDISINSTDTGAIRRAISRRMNTCDYFLCLIGEETHTSDWCEWEIEKAKELDMKLVAVKIKSTNMSPIGIVGVGATWANSFTYTSIEKAINNA